MKNIQHITSTTAIGHRMNMTTHHNKTPKQKPATGSITGMYPVILDDGRTIIYTSDKSKESEIRMKYASRNDNNQHLVNDK
jgi:hypothetical protein